MTLLYSKHVTLFYTNLTDDIAIKTKAAWLKQDVRKRHLSSISSSQGWRNDVLSNFSQAQQERKVIVLKETI
jgi:hypothetical protein